MDHLVLCLVPDSRQACGPIPAPYCQSADSPAGFPVSDGMELVVGRVSSQKPVILLQLPPGPAPEPIFVNLLNGYSLSSYYSMLGNARYWA